MAATLPTTSSSYLHSTTKIPKTSLSCASKVYVGLRIQSPNSYGVATSNLNVEFFNRVHKSIESSCSLNKEMEASSSNTRHIEDLYSEIELLRERNKIMEDELKEMQERYSK